MIKTGRVRRESSVSSPVSWISRVGRTGKMIKKGNVRKESNVFSPVPWISKVRKAGKVIETSKVSKGVAPYHLCRGSLG